MNDTIERIEQIFSDVLNISVPSPTTDIIASGALDSLVFVALLYEIEDAFGVELPLDAIDVERLRTIEQIAILADELTRSQAVAEVVA